MLILFKKKKIVQILQTLWTTYDPHWDKVVLQCQFNELSGGSFVDLKGKTITRNASYVTLDNSNTRFGTGAAAITMASTYTSVGNMSVGSGLSDFNFGTGDFTIEFWVKLNAVGGGYMILFSHTCPTGSRNIAFLDEGYGYRLAAYGAQYTITQESFTTTFRHVAFTRSAGVCRLFVDGVAQTLNGTSNTSFVDNFNFTGTTEISLGWAGKYNGVGPNITYLDDYRITAGLARYTTSFTPPTAAFPVGPLELNFDPYWDQTVLSIHGGQNDRYDTTFVDSSSHNRVVVPMGGPVQGTISPFAGIGGSIYFDKVGDYLTTSYTTNMEPASGDFTIEAWINIPDVSGYKAICSFTADFHLGMMIWNDRLCMFASQNGTSWNLAVGDDGSQNGRGTTVLSPNTWYHVSFVRSGTTLTTYVNGALDRQITGVSAAIIQRPEANLQIGQWAHLGDNYRFKGYISNFRYVVGTAVYTSTFTPPTAPLSTISGTALLLKATNSGAFNNHTFVDSSTNNLAITRTGNVSQGSFSPFIGTGGSAYFDGSGDYITSATHSSFEMGTGDFTIECWFNTAIAVTGTGIGLVDLRGGSNSQSPTLLLETNGAIAYQHAGVTRIVGSVVQTDVWYHAAVVRSSGNTKLYLNGVQVGSTYADTTNYTATTPRVRVGADDDGAPNAYLTGYISNVRVVKGSAKYTSNFTVPATPLSADVNTSLLLKFENAGIIDATRNNVLETVGSVSPTSSSSKFGATSIYFNGTSDYLKTSSPLLAFGTGDFTAEMWYRNGGDWPSGGYDPYDQIMGNIKSAAAGYWRVGTRFNGANNLFVTYTTGNYVDCISTGLNVNDGVWHHIALVRISGVLVLYVDGKSVGTAACTQSLSNTNFYLMYAPQSNYYTKGWIDDVRITKGIARYQTNFSPRIRNQTSDVGTTAYDPYWDKVVLRMPMDGADNGTTFTESTGKTVSVFGNTKTVASTKKFGTASAYFDGNGDYLALSNVPALGSGDFTIEAWVYASSVDQNGMIFDTCTPGAAGFRAAGYAVFLSNGFLNLYSNSTTLYTSTTKFLVNTWVHLAICRSSNNLVIYADGQRVYSASSSTNFTDTSFTIGKDVALNGTMAFAGYIDDLRITKGVARYTKNFTPPTQALPTSDYVWVSGDKYDPYWNNVVLHMPMDGDDNGTVFTELTGKTVSVFSGAKTVTAAKKFGTASAYFGGGAYITVSDNIPLGAGDFTIEFWLNHSNAAGDAVIYDTRTTTSTTGTIRLTLMSNKTFRVQIDSTDVINTTAVLQRDTWYHLAVVRTSGMVWFYINGVGVNSGSNNSNLTGSMLQIAVNQSRTLTYTGYLDDLRITKGKARYTQNFTVPTEAHPTFGASS